MTHKRFTPGRGQLFWYIEEVLEQGLPDLSIKSAKYNPEKHNKLIEKGNCYLTEDDAYESLTE